MRIGLYQKSTLIMMLMLICYRYLMKSAYLHRPDAVKHIDKAIRLDIKAFKHGEQNSGIYELILSIAEKFNDEQDYKTALSIYKKVRKNYKRAPIDKIKELDFLVAQEQINKHSKLKTLYDSIQEMHRYGEQLGNQIVEGQTVDASATVQKHALALKQRLNSFLASVVLSKKVNEKLFKKNFVDFLHRIDPMMQTHSKQWKPIVVNILIALTGIGLIALITNVTTQAIKGKPLKINNYLFFARTRGEQKIAAIENQFRTIRLSQ